MNSKPADPLDSRIVAMALGDMATRFSLEVIEHCASTSSVLLDRVMTDQASGSVVVCERQTAGRGRRGRSWLSAPGDSLTFSLLWRFTGPPGQLAGLSLAVGVALARGLENLGASGIRLKWPNDVLLERDGDFAKLAGILIELASERRGTQAIIGIGLNLLPPTEELPQPAAGLVQALVQLPDRHAVLASVLSALAGVLEAFAVDGFGGLKMEWQQRHAWQGLAVQVLGDESEPLAGVCLGADDDGALLLETAAGVQRILSGDLSLRRA